MRPPFYTNPEELQTKIDEYFNTCNNHPTITGLVLYCGFCSRQSFYAYEKKPEFSYTIKRARAMIEQVYEKALLNGGGAGAIFALKNFGWVDRQEVAHKGNSQHNETHIHYPEGWIPKEERLGLKTGREAPDIKALSG